LAIAGHHHRLGGWGLPKGQNPTGLVASPVRPTGLKRILMRRLLLVSASVTALSMPAATATQIPKSYLCEVKNACDLSDAGAIRPVTRQFETGARFQISIKTGEMIGAGSFSSSSWGRTAVLDPGTSSSGSSLKVNRPGFAGGSNS